MDVSKVSNLNHRRDLLKKFSLAALSLAALPTIAKDHLPSKFNDKIYTTKADFLKDKGLKPTDLVRILGYYSLNDGGGAEYVVVKNNTYDLSDEYTIRINDNISAVLITPQAIHYKMFGAVGDGVNNDAVQIQQAHQYANKKNIPVINLAGEYWLKEVKKITIQTPVQWGSTIFHINEEYNTKSSNRFEIIPSTKPVPITLSKEAKESVLSKLKPGVQNITEFEPYKNHLIVISDKNDQIGFRSGARFTGQAWAKEELFYVEEEGRIIGDIAWEFKNYTTLMAYTAEQSYLTVEGGTFLLSGNSPGIKYEGYKKNGFAITRSRTIIKNQWVGLEKNNVDVALDPRSGFYTISTAYEVTLEHIRLIPYIQDREGEEYDVKAGTYGISMGRVLKITFKNITAEGGKMHWGVFGTNLNKNFKLENCQLNRIDVHFHCWNLYIKDCIIGYRGISVTGGGDLFIENTSCSSRSFINFRRDFGSKWDGDIYLRNCKFLPSGSSQVFVLDFNPMNFDYKYPVGFGRSIIINDLKIDFTDSADKIATCWLINVPNFSKIKNGDRLFLPQFIEVNNVLMRGREKGLRIMSISSAGDYKLQQKGSYQEGQLFTNAKLNFINIPLEKITHPNEAHFAILNEKNHNYTDDYSLYPIIKFEACNHLVIQHLNAVGSYIFEQCQIAGFRGADTKNVKGRIIFNDCNFNPIIVDPKENCYHLDAEHGTSFTNCCIHIPQYNNLPDAYYLDKLGFIKINKYLKFNHLNTIIGRDVLSYLQKNAIGISPKFIAMLKSHHELEPENLS
jgi:hypothetical protein